jgi:hypothetical protein
MVMDEEFDRMYKRAVRHAREFDRKHPPATGASYDPVERTIRVSLRNGCACLFPADMGQGLRGATDEHLAQVEGSRLPATVSVGRSWTPTCGSPS